MGNGLTLEETRSLIERIDDWYEKGCNFGNYKGYFSQKEMNINLIVYVTSHVGFLRENFRFIVGERNVSTLDRTFAVHWGYKKNFRELYNLVEKKYLETQERERLKEIQLKNETMDKIREVIKC